MSESFGDIACEPDVASKIAAEIMGLKWTHGGDEDEHCNRHGQLQEIVAKHLATPTAKGGAEGTSRKALIAVRDRILAPDYGGIDDIFWMTPTETVVDFIETALAASPPPPAGGAGGGSGDLGAQGEPTDDLVDRFAAALKAKLRAAEAKYGWKNKWSKEGWQDDCQRELARHVGKGDPLDVASYAAFCWHHGWSTSTTMLDEQAQTVEIKMPSAADEAVRKTIEEFQKLEDNHLTYATPSRIERFVVGHDSLGAYAEVIRSDGRRQIVDGPHPVAAIAEAWVRGARFATRVGDPVAWLWEYTDKLGVTYTISSVEKPNPDGRRNIRPLGLIGEAPAAPRPGSGVSVGREAVRESLGRIWCFGEGQASADTISDTGHTVLRAMLGGLDPRITQQIEEHAEQILALVAQVPRDGVETIRQDNKDGES